MNLGLVDCLFYLFAALTVGGGVSLIISRNPVNAAMFMILSLVGVASLFVLLEAFFLAVLQVLVYAGAVMVLFLFIIMLLDVGPDAGRRPSFDKKTILSGFLALLSIGFFTVLLLVLIDFPKPMETGVSSKWPEVSEEASAKVAGKGGVVDFSKSVKSFGYGLFTKYMLPLQVAGFLLLAAMVGVIVLSKKRDADDVVDASIRSSEPESEEA